MKRKLIIGLIKDDLDSDAMSKITKVFSDIGFYQVSITAKVQEVAQHLLKYSDPIDETISSIRQRGYVIDEKYWINLVMASIPNNKDLILVDDLLEEDVIDDVIVPYVVTASESDSNDIETINVNCENLKDCIDKKIKRIMM